MAIFTKRPGILIALSVLAEAVAGCAGRAHTDVQKVAILHADFGTFPSNYNEIIMAYMGDHLKDSASAKYDPIPVPTKAFFEAFGHVDYGYGVCVTYATKNLFGGYDDYKKTYFLIRNGKIASTIDDALKLQKKTGLQMCS